jgi:hypothetical protein
MVFVLYSFLEMDYTYRIVGLLQYLLYILDEGQEPSLSYVLSNANQSQDVW